MNRKQLENRIKKFQKTMQKGDSAELRYEGETLGRYDFDGELTIDSKTPLQWLRQCLCFDVEFRGRDIEKVELIINNIKQ